MRQNEHDPEPRAKPETRTEGARPGRRWDWALVIVLAVMVLAGAARWRLSDMPLERDEGEYAYAGQLILEGTPPYSQAYNMKFPGTYYAYALVMAAFGETPRGIRLGLILVNAATTLLLFAMGRRLLGGAGGAIAAVAFELLSVDRWNLSIFAHATHFVLLPAVAGLYLLMRAPRSRRALWLLGAGFLLGVAVLMKQHALVFLPVGFLLVAWEGRERAGRGWRAILLESALLCAGALAPFLILCAVLWRQGVLGRFWFWAFRYAPEYIAVLPSRVMLENLQTGLTRATAATRPLWWIAGAGLAVLWVGRWRWEQRVFLTVLLIVSFVSVCPGFFFREHYFILMLPAVVLLDAVAFEGLARLLGLAVPLRVGRLVALAAFAIVCGVVAAGQLEFWTTMDPRTVMRSTYGFAPFLESAEVGRYLRAHAAEGDRIAIFGSEPEIYFYSHRRSATGYLYVYPLMETQPFAERMQSEMMAEIQRARPHYAVFVQETSSWNVLPTSDQRIVSWAWRYVSSCYRLVGFAEIFPQGTRYVWGDEVKRAQPTSPYVIFVYERTGTAPCAAGG